MSDKNTRAQKDNHCLTCEKILERREWNQFFKSFDELKEIEGMTEEDMENHIEFL